MNKPHEYPTTANDPTMLRRDDAVFTYEHKAGPGTCNLDLLSYGVYKISPNGQSDNLFHNDRETLLFSVEGKTEVTVEGQKFVLDYYDTLYIPLQTAYSLRNCGDVAARVVVCKALANKRHNLHYSSWKEISQNEERIRHLDGKDVFLMFDVTEPDDRLIAGYTIYEPYTRAWPPHNHTDQEEVYIFSKGNGAMEVYADEETKTFVTSMDEGDAVAIPVLNFHPVFSQEEELHFIWCIAGERY
ncbi:MAG: cupin domain-containing protein [Lentisphaerae bacterium]|jgi:mannose-6-phosphate isomerase-like protein (cupin superfamily)|nr:cupin domain-containing protein [Lentisphaerota bacterium]